MRILQFTVGNVEAKAFYSFPVRSVEEGGSGWFGCPLAWAFLFLHSWGVWAGGVGGLFLQVLLCLCGRGRWYVGMAGRVF